MDIGSASNNDNNNNFSIEEEFLRKLKNGDLSENEFERLLRFSETPVFLKGLNDCFDTATPKIFKAVSSLPEDHAKKMLDAVAETAHNLRRYKFALEWKTTKGKIMITAKAIAGIAVVSFTLEGIGSRYDIEWLKPSNLFKRKAKKENLEVVEPHEITPIVENSFEEVSNIYNLRLI
jgi:hypothetical protein